MTLNGVMLLAAYTARSKAYIQALAANGMQPEATLLFGDRTQDVPGLKPDKPSPAPPDLFIPDLSLTVRGSCEASGWGYSLCPAKSVNDDHLMKELKKISPNVVIYSGYGGQLVSLKVLDAGSVFLHMHSGWLPTYRGSTTIYYSMLEKGNCAVSALLLNEDIDTGVIVGRREYPRPPAGAEVDFLYDTAIRADTLVQVMREYQDNGKFSCRTQKVEMPPYFKIHPVLKHVALLMH